LGKTVRTIKGIIVDFNNGRFEDLIRVSRSGRRCERCL
jgi:hypothetical protein